MVSELSQNTGMFKAENLSTEVCPFDGEPHQIGIFKNCQVFPPDHSEFLHCLSCEAPRCVKCEQLLIT